MYQVLYRKYRPKNFDDVVGQPQVTQTLKNQLKLNRISHAYLFTGSRGTGKTTCAKILAKAINCLNPQSYGPCGECEMCKAIESESCMDIVEMDAASNRGIDDIRTLIEKVNFAPTKTRYRVYIIDEVHMLTNEAFNALLKTLEEPPKHVVFILATTDVHKLLDTITSRCQRFDFHRIKPQDVSKRIKYICEQEKVTITDEAASLISVICDGGLRDAVSLLDRCIGLSSDIDAEVVRKSAGLVSKSNLINLCSYTISKNVTAALELIDQMYNDSKSMSRLCDELISYFRSLMLIKSVKNPRDLLVMSDKEFEAALSQSDYLTLSEIIYYMDALSRSKERMGKGLNNRTELEMAIVKLCSPQLDITDDAVLSRISALEKAVKVLSAGFASSKEFARAEEPVGFAGFSQNTASAVSVKKEREAAQPKKADLPKEDAAPDIPAPDKADDNLTSKSDAAEIPSQSFETHEEDEKAEADESTQTSDVSENAKKVELDNKAENLESTPDKEPLADGEDNKEQPKKKSVPDLDKMYYEAKPFDQWQEVIANLKQYSRAIAAAFEDTNAYVYEDYLLIETEQQIAYQLLKKSAQRDNIRKAVVEITGKSYKLGPYKKPEKEAKKDNVLDNFINNLKQSGISVIEE